jgi:hypothetical protein
LLQQGSLLLGDSHVKLAAYLRVPEAERERLRENWRATAAPAGRWLGGEPPLARLAGAITEELGSASVRLDPSGAERLGLPE